VQVRLLPVSAAQLSAAEVCRAQLAARGLRVELRSHESLARRIAEAHACAVPHVAVIGAREAAAGTLSLRDRSGQQELALADAARALAERCAMPSFAQPA
jgi:threonyl-tRNA synthetase